MKINSIKGKRLAFNMIMENTSSTPKARLTIICDKDEYLSFPCTLKEDKINAQIPELIQYRHMLKNDSHNAFLEVFVDDTYFMPWEGEIVVEWPVAIKMFKEAGGEDEKDDKKDNKKDNKPKAKLIVGKDEKEDEKEDEKDSKDEPKKVDKKDDDDEKDVKESKKPTVKASISDIFEETLQD